ncbi:hypothetical protein PTTG_30852, partial [Puccinia triticina 1-1 BBBD Race 1]
MARGQIRPRPPSLVLSRSHSLSKKSPKNQPSPTTSQEQRTIPPTPPFPLPARSPTRQFIDYLRTWDDHHIAKWLADIKLPHLAPIFAENDIVGDILLDLDQQALKEMGVSKVGDRVKLLVAVKDLKQRCVREREQRIPATTTTTTTSSSSTAAQRPHHHHHHHHHHLLNHHPPPAAPRSVPNLYQQAQQQHTSVSPSAQHHHLNHLNQPSLSPSLLNQ